MKGARGIVAEKKSNIRKKYLRLCAKLLFTKFPTVCRVFDFTGLGQRRDLRKYPIIVKALRKRKTLPLIQFG